MYNDQFSSTYETPSTTINLATRLAVTTYSPIFDRCKITPARTSQA